MYISLWENSRGHPDNISFMQFSMKLDGFEQKDSQGFENSYNSYEQYPLEKFFIFTIYQNYTLALTSQLIWQLSLRKNPWNTVIYNYDYNNNNNNNTNEIQLFYNLPLFHRVIFATYIQGEHISQAMLHFPVSQTGNIIFFHWLYTQELRTILQKPSRNMATPLILNVTRHFRNASFGFNYKKKKKE